MKKLLLLGFALIISNSDARLPAGEQQTLTDRIFATAAMVAPTDSAFVVRSYGGKCLDFGSPPQVLGSTVFISACNGSGTQQVVVQEINQRHEVILIAGNKVIGVKATQATTLAGRTALVLVAKSDSENPLELQNEASRLTAASANQIFALDGDSIILAANPNLVVKVQNNRGADRTPLVLGRRDLADSEFWTFTAADGSGVRPTSGFVRISQVNPLEDATKARDHFLNAILHAQWGTVIELDPNVLLDLTGMQPVEIKAGVTIRGDRHGTRSGPLILNNEAQVSHNEDDPPFDGGMLFINGDHVRITGLRMQGPSFDIQVAAPYANGIAAPDQFISIIDHNEMLKWTAAAIYVFGSNTSIACDRDPRPNPPPPPRHANVRVVRNFIHHNHRWSSGYGVAVDRGAYASIEGNTFISNRHAITGDGTSRTGYSARFNLDLSAAPDYSSLNFGRTPDFDMHGTDPASGDHHVGGTAGDYVEIVRNTFLSTNRLNFILRGTPCNRVEYHQNISLIDLGRAIHSDIERQSDRSRLAVTDDNQFNAPNPTARLGVGDFDGDGLDDLFLATGKAWYYSPAGIGEWRFLNAQTDGIGSLLFGDFDGDGRADVFTQHGSDWVVSWGGASKYEKINLAAQGLSAVAIGYFDDDKRADVFYANGHEWFISRGGVGQITHFAFDTHRVSDLRFGDFNADGKTDIFGVVGADWAVVFGGKNTWSPLRPKLTDSVAGLMVADFNGDGRADVARLRPMIFGTFYQLETSDNGVGDFTALRRFGLDPLAAIGNFDSNAGADVLVWHDNFLDIASRGSSPPRKQSRQDIR